MMGPNRDGQATGQPSLASQWPKELTVAWKNTIGSGYGGAAVHHGTVFVLHRLGNDELLQAFELASGQKRWQTSWPASYRGSINPDNGPRCVPTISGDRAVCYGAAGDLACVDVRAGKLLWQRSLRSEYRAEAGYFGAGAAPLVVGDLIVVCLGGKQAGVVGIDLKSGQTRWTATDFDASYAAPIQVDNTTAMVVTRLATVLIDLENGKVLSEIAFGSRGPTVNAATPIPVRPSGFLLTASYGVGATWLTVSNRKIEAFLQGSDLLSSQYNTPVAVGARVIGINGREDAGVASLRAIDLAQRKVVWDQPDFGTAHLIAIGSQVLSLTTTGRLCLIDGRAERYAELAEFQLPRGTYRAPPALAGGRLIVRDTNADAGQSQLLAIELPLANAK